MYTLSGVQVIILENNMLNGNQTVYKKTKNFLTSMRFLILAIMILLATLPVVTFDLIFVRRYEYDVVTQKAEEVQKEAQKLSLKITGWIDSKKYDINAEGQANSDLIKTATSLFDNVLVVNKDYFIVDDTSSYYKGSYAISQGLTNALSGREVLNTDISLKKIDAMIPILSSSTKAEVVGTLIATYNIDTTLKNIDVIKSIARTLEVTILILSLIVAYIFALVLTRPYNRMLVQISKLTNGELKHMEINTFFETRQITDAFNKMLQKQIREDELKQEFVSNVSHELKTPITSVKVLADSILQQENVPNELYKEFLEDISAELDRESKIISDLLSLARLENTNAIMDFKATSINDMVNMIIKRVRPIADQRDIKIQFEVHQEVIARVDESKLNLVFTNLIENAIKYNVDGGSVKIYINADYEYFYFRVTDTGIGIEEEDQENIFDRFYRVDKARTSVTGGTGLGLSIARNIVIKHKGGIKVYSDGESGTTFTVRIPLDQEIYEEAN